MRNTLHIISATSPVRYEGHCEVWLKVWFEEFDGPIYPYCASPLDAERHGKELWIRAMAGEYGPVEIRNVAVTIELEKPEVRMLTYAPNSKH
jgi:hypothetical protein